MYHNIRREWTTERQEWNEGWWTVNEIDDKGASKLGESLKVNNSLTRLDLSCDDETKLINQIFPKG